MKRFFFFSFLLLAVIGQTDVIACNKSLAHTRFVCFGVRQVTLDFIDKHTCVLTQSMQMALPSGPIEQKDTLRYHIDNDSCISFSNGNAGAPLKLQKQQCEDYSALCYKPTIYVSRKGKPLKDYPITAEKITWMYKHSFLVERYLYTIPLRFKGYYSNDEHMMWLNFGEKEWLGVFLQIPADMEKVDWKSYFPISEHYDMMREDWNFCWFTRPRYIPSSSVTTAIIGHQFAYLQDTLSFLDDGICLEYRQALDSSVKRTYSIDGAYIILNHPILTKQAPDTLLYKDGIIYNAIVCQTKDSVELFKGIGPNYNSPKPTGTMMVIAYEDVVKQSAPDSVLGFAFQHYYMPINYRRE